MRWPWFIFVACVSLHRGTSPSSRSLARAAVKSVHPLRAMAVSYAGGAEFCWICSSVLRLKCLSRLDRSTWERWTRLGHAICSNFVENFENENAPFKDRSWWRHLCERRKKQQTPRGMGRDCRGNQSRLCWRNLLCTLTVSLWAWINLDKGCRINCKRITCIVTVLNRAALYW